MRCPAATHTTAWAYEQGGCICNAAYVAARRRWRERSAARRARRVRHPEAVSRRRIPDVDPIAVERACNGEPYRLTVPERTAAVAILTARGLSAAQIADRLGCDPRTVVHHRKRARSTA